MIAVDSTVLVVYCWLFFVLFFFDRSYLLLFPYLRVLPPSVLLSNGGKVMENGRIGI